MSTYSKHLQSVMERNYGKKLSESLKNPTEFTNKIMSHVQSSNLIRKKAPKAFGTGAYDAAQELEKLMHDHFKPVQIPYSIRRQAEQEAGINHSVGSRRRTLSKADALSDDSYVRRLKMANYGRWFLQPNLYESKVRKINREVLNRDLA